jgi:1-deoxy-D-xylulose-5-phosphate reductoisomerase
MGKKITSTRPRSPTRASRIEARWLLISGAERIKVLIHPEARRIGVEDGSVLATGPPDMRVPISFALNEEVRTELPFGKVDLAKLTSLSFNRMKDVFRPSGSLTMRLRLETVPDSL